MRRRWSPPGHPRPRPLQDRTSWQRAHLHQGHILTCATGVSGHVTAFSSWTSRVQKEAFRGTKDTLQSYSYGGL